MTSHEEMLERMSEANPLPDVEMITDGQLAEMTLHVERARRAGQPAEQPQPLEPTRTRVRWLRPTVAFAAALLVAFAVIGVVSLTTGGETDVAETSSTTSADTATPSTTTTVAVPPPEGWNPVLATIFAGTAPEPATCPPDTDPSQPGAASQERPAGSAGLLGAAFDHRTGRVIYVDEQHATWAFDVCTNTWTNLRPSGAPTGNISGWLVYDIDSDLTVSIEHDEIFVYDALTNTWENRPNSSDSAGGVGAAYDPVSGLIVTSSSVRPLPGEADPDAWMIHAYDVDTDTWYDLGVVPLPRETPCCTGIDLLGYSAELDRLILTTYVDEGEATLLLDPRTGELTTHTIPTPVVNLIWPGRSYGPGDTVYVEADAQVEDGRWNTVLCGFDPNQITWSRCHAAPEEFPALKHRQFNAIVGDPVNDRLLLLGGSYFSSTPSGIDDVWAIDLATGEWIEVLAPSELQPPTIEDQSGEFEPEETSEPSQGTPDAAPGEWNPILADTVAGSTPQIARCSAADSPNVPGPANQERPTTVEDDHDGAFDRRTGRVMYVDTMQRTWAFDVCTNTWHNLEPEGTPVDASLVYDIDSDVTIALGPGDFSVYDAATNTWTRPTTDVSEGPEPESFWGVAYDPVSGLVITPSGGQVWAFDVETGKLTMIGTAPPGGLLAGYVASLDRLVFVADSQTILVDPRTGEMTPLPTGRVPFVAWGWYDFFDAAGTVFIGADVDGAGEGCGFNPETLAWDLCYRGLSPEIDTFASRVEDSINERVVLIHNSPIQDNVWALDLDTGQMVELLAPSG